MACGLPQMMNMIAQKDGDDKMMQEASNSNKEVKKLEKKINDIESSNTNIKAKDLSKSGEYDWTRKYAAYKDFEDPDELRKKIEKEKEKEDNMRRRAAMGGCNHDHSAERRVYEMPFKEKITEITNFKEEGSAFFREGQYGRAREKVKASLVYFEYMFPEGQDEITQHDELKLACLLNMSAIELKLEAYDECIINCREILKMEANNVKALYRRARSYRMVDEYDLAKIDIQKAIELEPNDLQIRKEYQSLLNKILSYKTTSKQISQSMMRGEKEKDKEAEKEKNNNKINESSNKVKSSTSVDDEYLKKIGGQNEEGDVEKLILDVSDIVLGETYLYKQIIKDPNSAPKAPPRLKRKENVSSQINIINKRDRNFCQRLTNGILNIIPKNIALLYYNFGKKKEE